MPILLLCMAVPAAALGLLWLITFPDVSTLRTTNPTTTALIEARQTEADAKGTNLGRHWVWVPLSRMSPHLRRAVVAAEDASFFTHEGFDWEGMKDAALYNLEQGALKRGGSTITQQLAKNLFLSGSRTWWRKGQEAVITAMLETVLTKRRILEIYLNVAEWGDGVYGADAAARYHFGVPAAALTPAQAARLAVMLPSPRSYPPGRDTVYLQQRTATILARMKYARIP